jgi:hypothetical protein
MAYYKDYELCKKFLNTGKWVEAYDIISSIITKENRNRASKLSDAEIDDLMVLWKELNDYHTKEMMYEKQANPIDIYDEFDDCFDTELEEENEEF